MNRAARIAAAEETLRIVETGCYRAADDSDISIKAAVERAVAGTRLYRGEDFPLRIEPIVTVANCLIELTGETSLAAAQRLTGAQEDADICILNFASARNPGGGFLNGAQAQEESLARSSALYPCLVSQFDYYAHNRAQPSCLYSDWMIHAPAVPVFRDDAGELLLSPYHAAFITAPAVNAGAVRQNEPDAVPRIDAVNRERARKLLWLANRHRHRDLILGAWGCGVFRNDPNKIAGLFEDLLKGEFANCFARVTMAVFDRTADRAVYGAFAKRFGS
ncbi:TIGR02452 family protein [Flavisphingomonas formosensis]|uniref:TIGR02452 family protein n=1 Tax=Flavisphingomonas formosensis TaxID=861534 RepID=UPI0012F8AAEE|nr:TIGR02452 family protein [Sphingomonas formosensis]